MRLLWKDNSASSTDNTPSSNVIDYSGDDSRLYVYVDVRVFAWLIVFNRVV